MRGWGLILPIALAGCAGTLSPASHFATSAGPFGDIAVPISNVEERRFAGVVRQRFDFSCGSAALATLLRYHYGENVGEKDTFVGMWRDGDRAKIRQAGFSLLDMKRYLASLHLNSNGYKVNLDKIQQTGVPGIVLIQVKSYRHFVVVKGVDREEVLVGDPALGLRAIPRPEFEKAWNGLYFVLNSEQDRGHRAFNTKWQWASLPRAPIGNRFSDPVSLQALSLTAPFYRDF